GFSERLSLRGLAKHLFVLKAAGWIDDLPREISWFKKEDVARDILRDSFQGVVTPLGKNDRTYSLSDMSDSLALLYYLGSLPSLSDHCEPSKLAESVLHLQEAD